jgi:hypothetical protein
MVKHFRTVIYFLVRLFVNFLELWQATVYKFALD